MQISPSALFNVAGGAVLGACARYLLNVALLHFWAHRFPWATLLVNLVGCFSAGVLLALLLRGGISDNVRLFWVTGFLGALTTFSAFSVETLTLLQNAEPLRAGINVVANVGGSLLLVVLGHALAKQFI